MDYVNKILFWISSGLMFPTVVALIVMFVVSLVKLGENYQAFIQRVRQKKVIKPYIDQLKLSLVQPEFESNSILMSSIKELFTFQDSLVRRERVVAEFEAKGRKSLSILKNLAKMGPVVGLMGTLIPMGPALVGLSSGDIASMANNMQMAFATTVVGLIIGGIGFVLQNFQQRWFAEDYATLVFIVDLMQEENEKKKQPVLK
ncbi:MotA/TolQ/ExbB proton channel family protein [Flammeovirga yaeyamensis]|uniref:MotA/TolQ/ExbB proton channel family protein n=1 Tax=Flammeovirga yaeyamensis TaxID=367791 RepID=A0AAX1N587_9BACT|nr:MotA/TolQ/ExbB proton channel family protein [Flammeovirga yaeyamensis]MBB3701276.1 biopolymer transport protein ExbB/TolQ [Flammeovirga yaeyamensis]NMF38254.1 MotA/TolQ/ExbB proton channel family protein [Flammeovirga yaeyamensis]QWG02665.1 MotA/TolQ/ExbB proton channel family protein [Flammeovirga yaeyamensis]